MHLRVPSLLHLATILLARENRDADRAAAIIHLLYGTQAYTGDYHFAGFTAATLERHLARVGLSASSVGIKDGWLFEVEASKIPGRPAKWPEPTNLRIEDMYSSTRRRVTAPLRAIKSFRRKGE
jgi:hypothetical protein